MKLSEFIKETLVEIAHGAMMADSEYKEIGGKINPKGYIAINGIPNISSVGIGKSSSSPIVNVDFKLKVEMIESTDIEGGLGGVINVIMAKMGATKKESESFVQEISFSVPVVLPCGNQ